MSPTLSSQGVVLATAMAVSGTVILLAFRLQKLVVATQFPNDQILQSSQQVLRSCISHEGKNRGEKKKKQKRVHFAEDVVDPRGNSEEFRRQLKSKNGGVISANSSSSSLNLSPKFKKTDRGMPANRVALYNGILRDRVVHRYAYSY